MEKVVSVMFSYVFFSGQFRIFENSYGLVMKRISGRFPCFHFLPLTNVNLYAINQNSMITHEMHPNDPTTYSQVLDT